MPARKPVPNWLEPYVPVCEAVAALLHPFAEVVVHDLRRGRVVGLWNPAGGRTLGDVTAPGELPAVPDDGVVVGPYAKTLSDGRPATAVAVVLRNAKGSPRGLLCVELDRSPFESMIDVLVRFAAPAEDVPARLEEKDWRGEIGLVVDDACRSRGWRRDRLSRGQRFELVRLLDDRGLFATRNAAAHAGEALGVSRTTVYALLKEARS